MTGHGHGHHHAAGSARWLDFPLDSAGRWLAAVATALVVATAVAIAVLWPTEDIEVPPVLATAGVERVDVTIDEIVPVECVGAPDSPVQCFSVRFELPDGNRGDFQLTPSVSTPELEAGDAIVVADQGSDVEPRFRFYFLDFQRQQPLILLAVLFGGAVIVLGRLQGLRSLAALALSFVVLAAFTLPALLETGSPVAVAIAGSAAVAIVTLYLTHGISHLSTVALIGSLLSLTVTGLLAWFFVEATSLTGLSDEDALFLLAGNENVDLPGVLLAGMIIGTIGVLDDVTVTQASVVAELHDANPEMTIRRLYTGALRVGRDHIGSTTNTLVFAYAGAALPMLLLFTQARLSLGTVLTSEVVAIEVVQALVGGIGLVASVPLTTALAVAVVRGEADPEPSADVVDHL